MHGERLLDHGNDISMAQYNRQRAVPFGTAAIGYNEKPARVSQKGGIVSKTQTSFGEEGYKLKSADDLLKQVRRKVLQRGTEGIIGLKRCFRQRDEDNSNKLDLSEFMNAMRDYRIDLDYEAYNAVFLIFDSDRSGSINYEEFIQGLIGSMVQRRLFVVTAAFRRIDEDKNGSLSSIEIKKRYNAKSHPSVI
mmetsp:Transcript_15704/g.26475  ORF Transcript_15704/g.26475 Transcript_15704/m.26475 type:complete len:192 (+) Transcript_15704:2016-2591(+)